MKRHTWSDKHRPDQHHTEQHCWDCGMLKVGRHENERHWVEFHMHGKKIAVDKTPACEGRIEMNRSAA